MELQLTALHNRDLSMPIDRFLVINFQSGSHHWNYYVDYRTLGGLGDGSRDDDFNPVGVGSAVLLLSCGGILGSQLQALVRDLVKIHEL